MDLATLLGLLIAWGALIASLMLEGGQPADLVLLSPAVLVFGGTFGATAITASLAHVLKMPVLIKKSIKYDCPDAPTTARTIVGYARLARREGILGLEQECKNIENRFLRKGLELVVDGTASELIREILEIDISAMLARHKVGTDMLASAGGYAPTMGIIGTVMGLVHMLKSLSEPGTMGPAIAAAFLATLYGVCLANMFLLPLASKLKLRSHEEAATREMIIEGLLAIQAGDNPRIVEMKLQSFLPPGSPSISGPEVVEGGAADERRAA